MNKLKKGEKGLTLLELLIAIALSGIITTAATMAIFQTFSGSTRSANHMVAVRQVQEAGYWVSLYTYAAQGTEITGDSGFPLVLDWIDFDTGQKHEVIFSLNSSGLRGKYYVDSVFDAEKTGKIPAFEVINPDKTKTNCKFSGGSAFSLPDIGDAFNITGEEATPDNGAIIVSGGAISVTTTGGATYDAGTHEWTTTTAGDIITVTATSSGTTGSWTSETQAAVAGITVDNDADATLSDCKMLIFTVTATVGTGGQQTEETRIYKVVPKPAS